MYVNVFVFLGDWLFDFSPVLALLLCFTMALLSRFSFSKFSRCASPKCRRKLLTMCRMWWWNRLLLCWPKRPVHPVQLRNDPRRKRLPCGSRAKVKRKRTKRTATTPFVWWSCSSSWKRCGSTYFSSHCLVFRVGIRIIFTHVSLVNLFRFFPPDDLDNDWSIHLLFDHSIAWLIGCLLVQLIDWLIDRSV